ncbi:MAG: hypothetical protein ACR2OW_04045 [Methyloligellaceae bacterium]
MDNIEEAAFISVGRACGFAGLAAFCLMFGLSFDPILALKTGGIFCLGITLILAFYALRARSRPYKRTETWLLLAKTHRPPSEIAQKVIGEALRDTYLWFAKQAAIISILVWGLAFLLQILGVEWGFGRR